MTDQFLPTIRMANILIYRGFVFLIGFFIFAVSFSPLHALDEQTFLNKMRTKFRQTANIYLEARSHQIRSGGVASDTMDLQLAYSYPNRVLQYVQAENGRRQILIYDGKQMVLSYPHIDVNQRRSVSRDQFSRTLVEQVPFSALLLGVASDRVKADSISIEEHGSEILVRYPRGGQSIDSPRIKARFTRTELHPVEFIIENRGRTHRVVIREYKEDVRFPSDVEAALTNMDPTRLEVDIN